MNWYNHLIPIVIPSMYNEPQFACSMWFLKSSQGYYISRIRLRYRKVVAIYKGNKKKKRSQGWLRKRARSRKANAVLTWSVYNAGMKTHICQYEVFSFKS